MVFPIAHRISLIIALLLYGSIGHGSTESVASAWPTTVVINSSVLERNLGPSLHYLEDNSRQMDFDAIQKMPATRWQTHHDQDFRRGYSKSAFWMVVNLKGDENLRIYSDYMLEIDTAFMGYIDFYVVKSGRVSSYKTGLARPYSQRPVPSEIILLPLEFNPGEQQTLYIRVESEGSIIVPPILYERDTFYQHHTLKNFLLGFFFSLCIVLGLYNFFLFISIRDISYLFYTLNTLAMGWFQASSHGYTIHYFWKDNFRSFSYIEPSITVWICLVTVLLFSRSFLKLSLFHPRLDTLFKCLLATGITMVFLNIKASHRWIWDVFNVVSPVVIGSVLCAAIYALLKGNRAARFFLLGWTFFLITGLISTFYHQGILESNLLTKYGILFGSAIEGVLLSLALADRINWIQRERAEAQRQAVNALELSHKLKDDFLISISHELRTPLNGIMGAVELNRRESEPVKFEENNRLIEAASLRMAESVDGLLCLSELNSGLVTVNHYSFNIRQKIADLIESIHHQCLDKGLDFQVDIILPEPQHYIGDADKIRNILNQLLKNAIKFTHRGHIKLSVKERLLHAEKASLVFSVEDTGEGIPADKLFPIFEVFQQVSAGYDRNHEGLGIGLNICKRLTDLLSGEIHVDSVLGKGTRFEVSIPMRRDTAYIPAHSHQQAYVPQVLLVEDNIINQRVLEKILIRCQCKVTVANHGEEALAIVQASRPDLVFMDCQMPVMDGLEATRQIRKIYSKNELPIIAVTANALSNDRFRCLEAGMNDYLIKPAKLADIREALQRWLPQRQHI